MTKAYGTSDDLVEVEGDFSEEFGHWRKDTVLQFSDGTILRFHYGKVIFPIDEQEQAIWSIEVVEKGSLFKSFHSCMDPDDEIYSDVVVFEDGITDVSEREL